MRASRYLAWRILVRDLNARYRQTLLGFLWVFIPPVFVAVGLSLATRSNVINIAPTGLPYVAYVVFSMSLWQTFAEAINAPLIAIHESRPVLAKISFPREALLIAKGADVLVSLAVRFLLVIVVLILYGVAPPIVGLLAVPASLTLVAMGFSVGLALSPLAALYHDISRGVAVALSMMFFLTPVVFPVPSGASAFARLVQWNPVTPAIVTVRELASGSVLTMGPYFLVLTAASLMLLLLAWILFRVALPFVIERQSA